MSQEPDIIDVIEEEPDVTADSNSADIPSSSHDQDDRLDRLVLEGTTRKRTQPLPVYTHSRPQTPRLESVTTDVAVHTVDVGADKSSVVYQIDQDNGHCQGTRAENCNSQKREDVVTVL